MCGIVGYIGYEQAAPNLLSGLEKLEYRGYDSAGDRLIFWVKIRDWEYEEIPLPYSNTDMFKLTIEEDTDTTYLSLQ